jgi:hypothetical protein
MYVEYTAKLSSRSAPKQHTPQRPKQLMTGPSAIDAPGCTAPPFSRHYFGRAADISGNTPAFFVPIAMSPAEDPTAAGQAPAPAARDARNRLGRLLALTVIPLAGGVAL